MRNLVMLLSCLWIGLSSIYSTLVVHQFQTRPASGGKTRGARRRTWYDLNGLICDCIFQPRARHVAWGRMSPASARRKVTNRIEA